MLCERFYVAGVADSERFGKRLRIFHKLLIIEFLQRIFEVVQEEKVVRLNSKNIR